eukprot:SAG22_NODE_516_length_9563_cov_29.476965_6_plen_81_part_00
MTKSYLHVYLDGGAKRGQSLYFWYCNSAAWACGAIARVITPYTRIQNLENFLAGTSANKSTLGCTLASGLAGRCTKHGYM